MTRARKEPVSTRREPTGDIEWVGGILEMPEVVGQDGEPNRPEALFWLGSDGTILGATVTEMGKGIAAAGELLDRTVKCPMVGRPHTPRRVRVASAELAEALRTEHPWLEVVQAPTPELDDMLERFLELMSQGDDEEGSYLGLGIEPDGIASFFEAAALLVRARPWAVVPDDESLIAVSFEELGLEDLVVTVIGQLGESFGFLVFGSLDDYQDYRFACDEMELGEEDVAFPHHFALSFESGFALPWKMVGEIIEHGWELANHPMCPRLIAFDEEAVRIEPTALELVMAEAIARALAHLVAEKEALRTAWATGERLERKYTVPTCRGEMNLVLRTVSGAIDEELESEDDILGQLHALAEDDLLFDDHQRVGLERTLMRQFAASPEAKDLVRFYASEMVMDLGVDHLGETIGTIDAADLEEILFELVPRKVSIEASEGRAFVEELRAFFRFLKREHEHIFADGCLRVLGGQAVRRLEAALSDPSNFGMAKSLVMGGRDAGFPLDSEESVAQFMEAMRGRALDLPFDSPPPASPKPTPKHKKNEKKKKEKAARKARKRNR